MVEIKVGAAPAGWTPPAAFKGLSGADYGGTRVGL